LGSTIQSEEGAVDGELTDPTIVVGESSKKPLAHRGVKTFIFLGKTKVTKAPTLDDFSQPMWAMRAKKIARKPKPMRCRETTQHSLGRLFAS